MHPQDKTQQVNEAFDNIHGKPKPEPLVHANATPPKSPLEMVAAMSASALPGKKIIVLVDEGGQISMAGINVTDVDRLGLLEAGSILAKTTFAQGIKSFPTAPMQNEMKTGS